MSHLNPLTPAYIRNEFTQMHRSFDQMQMNTAYNADLRQQQGHHIAFLVNHLLTPKM